MALGAVYILGCRRVRPLISQVTIDDVLPVSEADGRVLLPSARLFEPTTASRDNMAKDTTNLNMPWLTLVAKGYFKSLGGYDIRGSSPSADLYAMTGWIPERIPLEYGFQKDQEWHRIYSAWKKADVMLTLGSGVIGGGLVPLHAYTVISQSVWLKLRDIPFIGRHFRGGRREEIANS